MFVEGFASCSGNTFLCDCLNNLMQDARQGITLFHCTGKKETLKFKYIKEHLLMVNNLVMDTDTFLAFPVQCFFVFCFLIIVEKRVFLSPPP